MDEIVFLHTGLNAFCPSHSPGASALKGSPWRRDVCRGLGGCFDRRALTSFNILLVLGEADGLLLLCH